MAYFIIFSQKGLNKRYNDFSFNKAIGSAAISLTAF